MAISFTKQLLAKSIPLGSEPHRSATLSGHLVDVVSSAAMIIQSTDDKLQSAFGLGSDKWHDRLKRTPLLAPHLHDLDKATKKTAAKSAIA